MAVSAHKFAKTAQNDYQVAVHHHCHHHHLSSFNLSNRHNDKGTQCIKATGTERLCTALTPGL